jgi:hypothetical protein
MTRMAAMIVTAAGAIVVTTGLALAESPNGVHDYWSRVERAQECAWGGGRAYAWGAPEYPCWNRAPPAGYYGSSAPPPGYYPPGAGYYGTWQRPPAYGYGWR